MIRFKNSFFYFGIIGGFSILMYWILIWGAELELGRNIIIKENQSSHWQDFLSSLIHNIKHPLAILLAQIVTIIFAARILGWICKKIGQPSVIGEIIAGILLGPSLLGLYFPEIFQTLFPVKSLGNLQFISQIGLILFMFVVGMELDLKVLKNKAHEAVVISHASIVFPFALGVGLSYFIYESFSPKGIQFMSFSLFIGIAMSITAFPVLARIVQERGIHKTRLGTIVITCAAADDITAWCLLAAVIAIVKAGSFVSSIFIIALAAIYVLIMIFGVKPFLKRVGELHTSKETISKQIVAIFFLTLIISSYSTEIIGIHALFGAFMAGAIMPENHKFRNIFIEKVEDVALVLLLPLFFVFTGLRTQIGLLNDLYLWEVTGLIVLVAVVGKFFGSAIAAKFVGQSWKDSLSIGALMNTRGLMELVVLNIGYDLGVLTPEIFAMMVIMALLTTFMTGPLLDLINWYFKSETPIILNQINKYKILFSFGNPERGKKLFKLANGLIKNNPDTNITAMHLFPTSEYHQYNDIEQHEKECFEPLVQESIVLNQKFTTLFKGSNDIDSDIAEMANKGDFDLLIVGLGQSIYEGSLLGKILDFTTRIINPEKLINQITGVENIFENSPFDERTRLILNKSKVTVGVFIEKEFNKIDSVFVPIMNENDLFLIDFAQKFIQNSNSTILFFDPLNILKSSKNKFLENKNNKIQFVNEKEIDKSFLIKNDLMLTSLDNWRKLLEDNSLWLTDIPSTLILSEKK